MTAVRDTSIVILLILALTQSASASERQPVVIQLYAGFGTPERIELIGRVLEFEEGSEPASNDSRGRNLRRALDRFESDEVADVTVKLRLAGETFTTVTDDEGIFRLRGGRPRQALPLGPLTVAMRVHDSHFETRSGSGTAWIIEDVEDIAVISDVDDTVVVSGVRHKARLIYNTATKNAMQLQPTKGVAAAYQRLQAAGVMAFFYVSGSPINLYGRVVTYLDAQKLPRGPVFLKNLGDDAVFAQDQYKLHRIAALVERYTQLKFILIGDSGERDPEIYREAREKWPERIADIVIRKVPDANHSSERLAGMHAVDDFAELSDWLQQLAEAE